MKAIQKIELLRKEYNKNLDVLLNTLEDASNEAIVEEIVNSELSRLEITTETPTEKEFIESTSIEEAIKRNWEIIEIKQYSHKYDENLNREDISQKVKRKIEVYTKYTCEFEDEHFFNTYDFETIPPIGTVISSSERDAFWKMHYVDLKFNWAYTANKHFRLVTI